MAEFWTVDGFFEIWAACVAAGVLLPVIPAMVAAGIRAAFVAMGYTDA